MGHYPGGVGDGWGESIDRRTWRGTILLAAGPVLLIVVVAAVVVALHRKPPVHTPHSRAGDACPIDGHGALVAFDLETGKRRWSNIVPSDSALVSRHGEVLVIADGVARTVAPRTGAIRACRATKIAPDFGVNLPTPTTVAGRAVDRFADGIRSVPPKGRAWSRLHVNPVAVVGDDLLVAHGAFREARTTLLDGRTGARRWQVHGMPLARLAPGGLVLVSDGLDAVVDAYHATDGTRAWRQRLTNATTAAAGLDRAYPAGGDVVVPDGRGTHFSVLDGSDGHLRWAVASRNPATDRVYDDPGRVTSVLAVPSHRLLIVVVPAFDDAD